LRYRFERTRRPPVPGKHFQNANHEIVGTARATHCPEDLSLKGKGLFQRQGGRRTPSAYGSRCAHIDLASTGYRCCFRPFGARAAPGASMHSGQRKTCSRRRWRSRGRKRRASAIPRCGEKPGGLSRRPMGRLEKRSGLKIIHPPACLPASISERRRPSPLGRPDGRFIQQIHRLARSRACGPQARHSPATRLRARAISQGERHGKAQKEHA